MFHLSNFFQLVRCSLLVLLLTLFCCNQELPSSLVQDKDFQEVLSFIEAYQEQHYAFTNQQVDSVLSVARVMENHNPTLPPVCSSYLEAISKFRKENLVESLPLFLKALEFAKTFQLTSIEGAIYQSIARVHMNRKNTQQAMSYQREAHRIWVDLELKKRVGHSLNFQGMLQRDAGNYDQSLNFFNQAVDIFDSLQDKKSMAPTLDQLAKLYRAKGELKTALRYHLDVYDMVRAFPENLKVRAVKSVADCYALLFDYERAFQYYREAIDITEDTSTDKIDIFLTIVSLEMEIEDWEQAHRDLNVAFSLLKQLESPQFQANAHEMMARVEEQRGNLQEANKHLKSLQQVSLEAQKFNNSEVVQKLTLEHEAEKKDLLIENQESKLKAQNLTAYALVGGIIALSLIILLISKSYQKARKSNLEIRTQKDVIQKNLQEREVLLKEIHHRVKNNLQIVSSLLQMQSGKFDNKEVQEMLEHGQGRVRSMSLIHEKLYQGDDLKSIPFNEYLKELITEIQNSFGEGFADVSVDLKIDDLHFDVSSAVPLGLILNELVTNSFKYAFDQEQPGVLSVSLVKDETSYLLKYSDNGKGLPVDLEFDKTKSLGLRLVRVLSHQLEGDYECHDQNGFNFQLRFSA